MFCSRFAPNLVSNIVNAFCSRDIFSFRTENKMNRLPLKEIVFTRVRFTHFLFAQIMSQRFDCPKLFRLSRFKKDNKDPVCKLRTHIFENNEIYKMLFKILHLNLE